MFQEAAVPGWSYGDRRDAGFLVVRFGRPLKFVSRWLRSRRTGAFGAVVLGAAKRDEEVCDVWCGVEDISSIEEAGEMFGGCSFFSSYGKPRGGFALRLHRPS